VPSVTRFETYCRHKEKLALTSSLSGFRTIEGRSEDTKLIGIGNDWTRRLFDGDFYRAVAEDSGYPIVSDKHLIYEGLSRVDADAVLAGATTARGERMVFSVWHPELVDLRRSLGHARHPAQIAPRRPCCAKVSSATCPDLVTD